MAFLRSGSLALAAICALVSCFQISSAALAPDRLIETGYLRALSKTVADERLPEWWTKSFADMFDVRGLADADWKPLIRTKNGIAIFADRLVGDDLYSLALAYRDTNNVVLRMTSGYRSVEEQAFLYAKYTARGDEKFSTPAYTSEHHLGTAFDFGLGGNDVRYAWLSDHGWEYGFVQSYPDDCIARTGVTEEPWHYRWIGRELAAEYHEKREKSETTYCPIDFYREKFAEFQNEKILKEERARELKTQEEASRTIVASDESAVPVTGSVLKRTGCLLIFGLDALSGSGFAPESCR